MKVFTVIACGVLGIHSPVASAAPAPMEGDNNLLRGNAISDILSSPSRYLRSKFGGGGVTDEAATAVDDIVST